MISAIYSESTIISASLGHIQSLVLKSPDAISSSLQSRPELDSAFDTALTGCMLVFSVLDDEIQRLNQNPNDPKRRMVYLWKEDTMKELLQQLRGQQTALTLLVQALQMYACLKTSFANTTHISLGVQYLILDYYSRRTIWS